MEIFLYKKAEKALLQIKGRFVLDECDLFKETGASVLSQNLGNIYLDLKEVDFIDSAGLGALVGFKMEASKKKVRFVLMSPSKTVSDVLYVSKLDSIFDIISGSEAELLKASLCQPDLLLKKVGALARQTAATSGSGSEDFVVPENRVKPRETPEGLSRKAIQYMREHEYEKAAELYTKVLDLDPEYLPALNNLAVVYEKNPAWRDKAIEQWQKVLEVSEKHGDQKHKDRASRHLENLKRKDIL